MTTILCHQEVCEIITEMTKTTGKIPAQPDADRGGDWKNVPHLDIEVTIPFKNLSNFWRSLIYFWLTAK